MLISRTIWCDAVRPDGGICTQLADHEGDHYDCVTGESWTNWDAA